MSPDAFPAELTLGGLQARAAGDQDLPKLYELCLGATDYLKSCEKASSPERWAEERLADVLADDTRRLMLLEGSAGLIGLLDLQLHHPWPGEATVVLFLLRSDARRGGTGTSLMQALFNQLKTLGFETVRLGVRNREKDAARFWTGLGMWESGREPGVRIFELPLREATGG